MTTVQLRLIWISGFWFSWYEYDFYLCWLFLSFVFNAWLGANKL